MLLGVVVAFAVGVFLGEVGLDLLFDDGCRDGNLNQLDELVQDLVAGFYALANNLGLSGLLGEVLAEFSQGVEFGCQLCEVIVCLGKLALLDGLDYYLDLGASPACSPPTRVVSKIASSSAERPETASSRPSSMVAEPTW